MPRPDTHELASADVAPTACAAASTMGSVPPTPATVAIKAAEATDIKLPPLPGAREEEVAPFERSSSEARKRVGDGGVIGRAFVAHDLSAREDAGTSPSRSPRRGGKADQAFARSTIACRRIWQPAPMSALVASS